MTNGERSDFCVAGSLNFLVSWVSVLCWAQIKPPVYGDKDSLDVRNPSEDSLPALCYKFSSNLCKPNFFQTP